MGYLAIIKETSGKIDKYQRFENQVEADSHVATYGGFVVQEPVGAYSLRYCVVDASAKTITYDSATHSSDNALQAWTDAIHEADSDLMPRWAEDIISVVGTTGMAPETVQKYNDKQTLRASKPV